MGKAARRKAYSIGTILSDSWDYFTSNFWQILIVVLAVYIPLNILAGLVPLDAFAEGDILQAVRVYSSVIGLLEFLVGIIATMAIACIVKSAIEGKPIDAGKALRKALLKWPAVILTGIIFLIFIFGLTLLLVIPAIIYYFYWMFWLYAVLFYNKSAKSALDYSKSVVKGRWWKVLGYSIVFGILASVVGFIAGALTWLLPGSFIIDMLSLTIIDVVSSYFVVVFVVFFIKLDSSKPHESS